MLWTPPHQFSLYESNITVPVVNAMGTVVTAGGSAHTKNTTYTELIAATTFDCYWIEIVMSEVGLNATDTGTLVDIAIGAASNETVIIPNLNAGHAGTYGAAGTMGGQKYVFPLYIPSGSRISATSQAVVASDTVVVLIKLYGGTKTPVWAGQQVVTYGANTSTSQGVVVTAATSGAEGTYTEIVASTSQDHSFLTTGLALDDATSVSAMLHLDIGIGAATEANLMLDIPYSPSSSESLWQPWAGAIWHPIPSGSRLAARISQSGGSASTFDVILYGVS